MVRRWFVSGATGFIGRRLVERLRARGDDAVALVRDPGRARELQALGVQLVEGDVTDPTSLIAPMRGTDGVFHLAAWYKVGVMDRGEATRVNIVGTRNVLDAMRRADVPKGVYTSSLAVFGDTGGVCVREGAPYHGPKGVPMSSDERAMFFSEYDRTKWAAHHEVARPMMEEGLPLVIVQPGVVYGPGDPSAIGRMMRAFLRGRLPMVPARTAYCWGHVADTVTGHIQAMERGGAGEEYILAGPDHTLVAALDLAARITGRPAPRIRVPPALLRGAAAVMGGLEDMGMRVPRDYAPETLRVAAGVTYLGDAAKARDVLGFAARPLEEGLRETLTAEASRLGDLSSEGRHGRTTDAGHEG